LEKKSREHDAPIFITSPVKLNWKLSVREKKTLQSARFYAFLYLCKTIPIPL